MTCSQNQLHQLLVPLGASVFAVVMTRSRGRVGVGFAIGASRMLAVTTRSKSRYFIFINIRYGGMFSKQAGSHQLPVDCVFRAVAVMQMPFVWSVVMNCHVIESPYWR